jgi:hypothetical protein
MSLKKEDLYLFSFAGFFPFPLTGQELVSRETGAIYSGRIERERRFQLKVGMRNAEDTGSRIYEGKKRRSDSSNADISSDVFTV